VAVGATAVGLGAGVAVLSPQAANMTSKNIANPLSFEIDFNIYSPI
jgi:hypothetical protein